MKNKEIIEADKRFEELGYRKCREDKTCALYSYSSEDKDYEVLFEKQKEEIVLSNYHDEDAEITRFELSFPELYAIYKKSEELGFKIGENPAIKYFIKILRRAIK